MFCKKGIPKNLEKIYGKRLIRSQEFFLQAFFLWILQIFQIGLFCRTSVNVYLRKYIHREKTGDGVLWSTVQNGELHIKPLQPPVAFLYPLKTSENRFQGV